MFAAAITDASRMPPRCCTLLQIHSATLTPDTAQQYRVKFEEWLTRDKLYCPLPTCSVFLPQRLVPSFNTAKPPSMTSILSDIVSKVSSISSARSFKGQEPDLTTLPGYTAVVARHVDLATIRERVNGNKYMTTKELTNDMHLLTLNIRSLNGQDHPMCKAADHLFETYLVELSEATDRLIRASGAPQAGVTFACPVCHVSICVRCKQVEHGAAPCDTTASKAELAMLASFGYKQCPLCKHAVKKMYGCPHIQCVCGAHWCYYCEQSVEACGGGCADGEINDLDEEDGEVDGGEAAAANAGSNVEDSTDHHGPSSLQEEGSMESEHSKAPAEPLVTPTITSAAGASQQANMIATPPRRRVDLDAGGGRVWAEADLDFGEEPEDHEQQQVWSCHHSFEVFKPTDDGYNHGDLNRMECNRCFEKVVPRRIGRKRARDGLGEARECEACYLIVCTGCASKYEEENEGRA